MVLLVPSPNLTASDAVIVPCLVFMFLWMEVKIFSVS